MRIAFLVDQFPTLSETFILNQITGLIDRGHEVDIYCDKSGNLTQTHPEIPKYQLLTRTYYTPIPINKVWRIIKAVWLFGRNFFKAPKTVLQAVNLLKYNRSNYGEPASFLKPLYLIIPWLKQLPYDIVFCHFGRNGLKANLLRDLGLTKAKIVVVFHGYDISLYLAVHGQDIYQNLFRQVDLVQPISQHWQRKLLDLGCPETKILVHHMGIDCNKFQYLVKQLSHSQIRLVSIARLIEKKGLQYSIQAVAQLIPRYPDLEYQIIGDGVLKEDLEQLINQLNITKNVKLLGWRQQLEVAAIIAQADIFLAPSITSQDGDCEGIPVSLMESMARGLPVISTYHSGIPELIENGVSGYLLPERDVTNLATKIEHLITNTELRHKMGQAGRQKVETDYNIQILNDRLVQILQQLLSI
jgi:colanic acid/amylovoran biosynthesis glycosyltransferase